MPHALCVPSDIQWKKNYIVGSPVMLKNERFSTVKKQKQILYLVFF